MSKSARRGVPTPKGQRNTKPKDASQWRPGYRADLDERCGAETVREPERMDWSPEEPDTVVAATCIENRSHKGWHLSEDGYAWDPEDDAKHCQFKR